MIRPVVARRHGVRLDNGKCSFHIRPIICETRGASDEMRHDTTRDSRRNRTARGSDRGRSSRPTTQQGNPNADEHIGAVEGDKAVGRCPNQGNPNGTGRRRAKACRTTPVRHGAGPDRREPRRGRGRIARSRTRLPVRFHELVERRLRRPDPLERQRRQRLVDDVEQFDEILACPARRTGCRSRTRRAGPSPAAAAAPHACRSGCSPRSTFFRYSLEPSCSLTSVVVPGS